VTAERPPRFGILDPIALPLGADLDL